MNGMTVKIDKAGRIVVPKNVRDRLRLHAGADLAMEETPEGILLKPVRRRPSLIEKNGFLVHRGQAPNSFEWSRLLEDNRDERIEDLARP